MDVNMSNNIETINKRDLCNVVTPKLINDIVDAIWWAEDIGWEETEVVVKLQSEIDKIAGFCNIAKPKDEKYGTYVERKS